jgi:hypothetical protein
VPELELLAVATGDVDCSGSLDLAVLYSTREGDLVVEIAQGVPEDELPKPISTPEGPTLEFYDVDGDRCDDLLVTAEREQVYTFKGVEHGELLGRAVRGEGDSVPDSFIELKSPESHPTAWLQWGSGVFEPCNWDKGCVPNECAETCSAWGFTSPVPCGSDRYGNQLWCYSWACIAWKQQCI